MKSKCEGKYKLHNVAEAFSIISKMLDSDDGLGLAQLSKETAISKNKTFRLLSTLEEFGIVEKNDQRNYKLGMVTIGIAHRIMAKTSLLGFIRPYMQKLASLINETVYFAHCSENEAVLIDYIDCRRAVKVASLVGTTIPLHKDNDIGKNTSRIVVGDIALHIDQIGTDVTTVTLPFVNDVGVEIGAIVILAPAFRLSRDRISTEIVKALTEVMQLKPFSSPDSTEKHPVSHAHQMEWVYGKHPAFVGGIAQKMSKTLRANEIDIVIDSVGRGHIGHAYMHA